MKDEINEDRRAALLDCRASAACTAVADHEDSAGEETDDNEDAEDPNSSLPPRLRFIKLLDVSDKFLDVSATFIC